jgi:hypothetical protein
MKARIVCLAALWMCAASAAFCSGCKRNVSPASDTPGVKSSLRASNDVAWEYKTVERLESTDQAERERQLRLQMQDFQREGWLVVSFSKPVPQTDGTLHRKYEVKRIRQ